MKILITLTDTPAGARMLVEKEFNGVQDHEETSVATMLAHNVIAFIKKVTSIAAGDSLVVPGNKTTH